MLRKLQAVLGLVAIFSFAVAPVCGSPIDVDPEACCESHNHAADGCDTQQEPTPQECCERGSAIYPVMGTKPATAGFDSAPVSVSVAVLALPMSLGDLQVSEANSAFRSPSPPGHSSALHTVLRI
jgi:hypothetical protein